jgi:hypothetical protein
MIVAAVLLMLFGGAGDTTGSTEPSVPPQITLVAPASGEQVSGRVPVVFQLPLRLQQGAGGWHVGQFHMHASIDGAEFMPGPADIQPVGTYQYQWTFPPLPPGSRTVRLFWSGPDHRPLPEGASAPVTVEVRAADPS